MLKRILLYLFLTYAIVSIYVFFFANDLIFYKFKPSYKDNENIIKITTADGAIISAIYLPNKKATYTVLVSHGNAEDLGHISSFLQTFQAQGFAVFAYDYHGYGTSTGKPSEKNSYADINAAYDYLTTKLHVPPDRIILYGRSIGAAVAIDLAVRKPIAGLIIESPFLTAYRTVTQIPLFPFDKFNNLAKIKKIKVPILVIHGKQDREIPFWQGKKLYEIANPPKQNYWVEAGHNDLEFTAGPDYWELLQDFAGGISENHELTHKKPTQRGVN